MQGGGRKKKKRKSDVKTEAREKVDGNAMRDSEFLKNQVLSYRNVSLQTVQKKWYVERSVIHHKSSSSPVLLSASTSLSVSFLPSHREKRRKLLGAISDNAMLNVGDFGISVVTKND